jgi:peptide/nickel transport system permease protein
MIGYTLRRLVTVVLLLAAMSLVVFLATHALPSNTAELILGQYSTPATRAALEHKLGLDLPLPVQYWRWASAMLHGDMGQSMVMERPVAPVLWFAFGNSAILAVSAMMVVATLGVAMGVVAAVWHGRWPDHAVSIFSYVGIAVPEFYWGLVLILVFSSIFHLLPTSGLGNIDHGLDDFLSHLVLPVVTLTLTLLAHVSRLTRSSMTEELDSMYVKVARARGLPERTVVLRHALRNALLPTITVLAQDFGFLIGGIVAVETIFAYPGLGQLLIFSMQRQDLPLMQGAILVLTAVFCLANLIADLLYGVVNPRIRYGGAVD